MKVRFRHRTNFGPDERNHSVNERNAVTWRQKTPQLRPRCFPASELRKLGFAFILKTEAQGALTRVTPPSLVSRRGISECLPRLTCMVRGIGDPLVAVYARAYLCRVGRSAPPCSRAWQGPASFGVQQASPPPHESPKTGLCWLPILELGSSAEL